MKDAPFCALCHTPQVLLLAGCVADAEEPRPDPGVPFWLGVNLPWVEYAVDVHTTAWGDYTLSADPERLDAALDPLAEAGVRSLRWWLFGDGRAAPTFEDGLPLPVDEEVATNFGILLDAADARGLTVMPVVLDFGWCAAAQDVNGVTLGGHARVFDDAAGRAALTDAVLPLAEQFADHPALAGWDLFNEPEWGFDGELYGLDDHCDADGVRAWVDDAGEAIEALGTPTTVGSASYAWMTEHWVDARPSVLQFHDYWEPIGDLDAALGKPVIVGEFPTADADLGEALDGAWDGGFAGAAPWSALAEDDASDLDLAAFRAWGEGVTPAPANRGNDSRSDRPCPKAEYLVRIRGGAAFPTPSSRGQSPGAPLPWAPCCSSSPAPAPRPNPRRPATRPRCPATLPRWTHRIRRSPTLARPARPAPLSSAAPARPTPRRSRWGRCRTPR